MAGAMRKMGIYLGLVEDDENAYAADYAGGDGYYAEDDEAARVEDHADGPGRREPTNVRSAGYPLSSSARSGSALGTATLAATPMTASAAATSAATSSATSTTRTSAGSGSDAGYDRIGMRRITTLHPRTYNEARTIGEHFREGVPVIMNLTEMDDSDAKRLVDFAAGLSFGLRGSIERVTNKVFLISPPNVSVTAEDKARIAEGGFFNQS